jgi:Xaa-Pro dipeptidase
VVIDNSGVVDGYVVDQTRVLSIGPLPGEWQAAFDVCLEIQEGLQRAARTGIAVGDLYALAAEKAAASGYADAFMGASSNQVSFIGHGVGLEIDEPPLIARGSSRPLAADNVVAVEPKLVFAGRGAVGIENTWRVTDEGLERLTLASDAVWEV